MQSRDISKGGKWRRAEGARAVGGGCVAQEGARNSSYFLRGRRAFDAPPRARLASRTALTGTLPQTSSDSSPIAIQTSALTFTTRRRTQLSRLADHRGWVQESGPLAAAIQQTRKMACSLANEFQYVPVNFSNII